MSTIPARRAAIALLSLTLMAPALAAEKGTLRIETDPGDATIFVNGQRKGNSPAEKGQTFAIKLDEGEYQIEAKKPDGEHEFSGRRESVYVAPDTLQTISIKMERRETGAGKQAREERERQAQQARAERERQAQQAQAEALRNKEEALRKKYANGIPLPQMAAIPGGSFKMGCVDDDPDCESNEKPVHQVQVSAFEMSKTEATFEQWDACVELGGCKHRPEDEGWGRSKRPVINVSWDDAQQYIQWLNQRTGKNYRLPTEAEWEYACRAGGQDRYCGGDDLDALAWYTDNSGRKTHPVGGKQANAWGLYDMSGNVWEWTCSAYDSGYGGSEKQCSGKNDATVRRVLRGGSWIYGSRLARAAFRSGNSPGIRDSIHGFRLARTISP